MTPARENMRRDRGAVVPLTALLVTTLVLFVAFSVDLGRLMVARRDMQSAADVVALDMSRLADGRTEAQILTDPSYSSTLARVMAANGLENDQVLVDYGVWNETARTFKPTLTDDVPNAARVQAERSISYFFQPGGNSASRDATSYQRNRASLSLGSKFASFRPSVCGNPTALDPCTLDPTGVKELDAFLSTLFGVDVSLGAATYEGLLTANVTAADLAAAAGFASVDEFAEQEFTAGEIAGFSAQAMENNGDLARAAYFAEVRQVAQRREDAYGLDGAEATVPPNDYLGFGAGIPAADSAAAVTLNLFDLTTAAVEASNARNGLTGCTGTTAPTEVETNTGGVVDPVDLGPAALLGDQLCTKVVDARKRGIGGLVEGIPDPPVRPPEFRTAQFAIEYASLLRFGSGNFGVPGLNLPPAPDPSSVIPELSAVPGVPALSAPDVPIPVQGDLEIPIQIDVAGAQGTLTEVVCDEETNFHSVDALVELRPVVVALGSGQSTPIGTVAIEDPVTGATVLTVKVFLDKSVEPAANPAFLVEDLPVGETANSPGSNPFLDLTVGANDIRVEGLPTVPTVPDTTIPPTDTSLLDPVTSVVGLSTDRAVRFRSASPWGSWLSGWRNVRQEDPSSTTSTSTTSTSTTSTSTTSTSLPTTTTTSSTTLPSLPTTTTTSSTTSTTTTTTTLVPPPPIDDPTEEALREYFATVVNQVIQDQISPQLQPVLDNLGASLTSADLTNAGIGYPVYDAAGNVVAFDIQCATPTLVD